MKVKFELEKISNFTWRAKIIGGWVLLNTEECLMIPDKSMRHIANNMIFIPDPHHKWKIEVKNENNN